MTKGAARTYGQDLMRGEHTVGGGRMKVDPKSVRRGTFQGGAPDTVRDAAFCTKKRAAEAKAGRPMTVDEYRATLTAPGLTWVGGRADGGDLDETSRKNLAATQSGTSIFDPVLCELAYTWFCPPGGTILDPFAGGSVRGIVASKLGRAYIGHELRAEQVDANRVQGADVCGADPTPPVWIMGDSRTIDVTCADVEADMIFSCPPYADLEVYSDDPRDLSAIPYADFVAAYREIIAKSCARLKPDRFACFVVGEVRDKRGNYYNFVGDTIRAFTDAGLAYYNEAILVTAVGSLPIRAGRQFDAGRKIGKTHQNVLVFVKGSGKAATKACGPVEVYIPDEIDEADEGAP